jgi:general nucleoside transport system ATP-binding protein
MRGDSGNSFVSDSKVRLALRGIVKRYPTIVANDGVDLTVRVGEIHAVLGENGAGKSTLVKVAYGVTRPDEGSIEWEGRTISLQSPADARQLGIGMVFQHFSLFETLTVSENIALASGSHSSPAALATQIIEVAKQYGLPVDPNRLVHGMSVGERQRVEIIRCLLQEPRLLIMDEPTSVLTPTAVLKLFETLRRLASEGVSILYISHKLDEIRALCDTATVLRSGKVVATVEPRSESHDSLARLMVGGELRQCRLVHREPGQMRLEVTDLSLRAEDPFGTSLQGINFGVRAGEILGVAGISGNGQAELLAALSGETRVASAAIRICGRPVGGLDPGERRSLGLTYVPEERMGRGSVPELTLAWNSILTGASFGLVRHGILQKNAANAFARETIAQFQVKGGDEHTPAGSLSGGNLQKFIVGREVQLGPKVMIVAQPTWGVDIGAAQLIRQALIDLRDRGTAVLVISEELDELFTLCDRIAVLSAGRLSDSRPSHELTSEAVGLLMGGQGEKPATVAGAPHV